MVGPERINRYAVLMMLNMLWRSEHRKADRAMGVCSMVLRMHWVLISMGEQSKQRNI